MVEIQGTARVRGGPDLPCRLVIEADDHGDITCIPHIDRPADYPHSVVDIDCMVFLAED